MENNTIEIFKKMQNDLSRNIKLENSFSMNEIRLIAGIDLAYWEENEKTLAVCCICVVDLFSKEVVETKFLKAEIEVPYIPGYLSFRELPLIMNTFVFLEKDPDIIMFDGNGYLHPRNMGIATHASFYLNKPTIGIAKSYLKIEGVDFIMPDEEEGAFSDIVINHKIYGRALRTHKSVKPIFVSCGNWINIDTATDLTLALINKESRLPVPIRQADLETKKMRKRFR
ncbi:endonuclease V [Paenibacillus sp. 2TAF8]|jgi:deoxyribonuclease V|uniref:endonuclease V n=1 Tax=Paenibacillus sp. JNUCC-31 TaxID=2777983 RepID=UPI001E4DCE00|nr:endonuclease V [Paenibacillus sp. JNUCC-31]